eukprot:Clim_evm17s43 gene=Clim_evmTU17s43
MIFNYVAAVACAVTLLSDAGLALPPSYRQMNQFEIGERLPLYMEDGSTSQLTIIDADPPSVMGDSMNKNEGCFVQAVDLKTGEQYILFNCDDLDGGFKHRAPDGYDIFFDGTIVVRSKSSGEESLGSPEPESVPALRRAAGVEISTLLEELQNWSFDVFSVPETDLYKYADAMFHAFDFMDVYKVDAEKLTNLVLRAQWLYRDNPYHSFYHAVDVMQAVFLMLTEYVIDKQFTSLEVFALLTSAMLHDAGHPGLTNNFLIETWDPWALRWNDRSPLENHHTAALFGLLENPESSIWENLNPAEKRQFRGNCIEIILATDTAYYADTMRQYETLSTPFEPSSTQDRTLGLQLIMQLGDISNPTRPLDLAKVWTDRIVDELLRQGDREVALGMQCSAFSDCDSPDIPRFSIGFIDNLAAPWYDMGVALFPPLTERVEQLKKTREYWENQIEA